MADSSKRPTLKVKTEWIDVEIVSEPYVVMTFRGYAPVVDVKAPGEADPLNLFISSKSISLGIDAFMKENGGKFAGLKLRIRKESDDRMAPYVVEKS